MVNGQAQGCDLGSTVASKVPAGMHASACEAPMQIPNSLLVFLLLVMERQSGHASLAECTLATCMTRDAADSYHTRSAWKLASACKALGKQTLG